MKRYPHPNIRYPRILPLVLALVLAACAGSHDGTRTAHIRDGMPSARPMPRATAAAYPVGGRHKPSLTGDGVLRVLVIFVRFRDDNSSTASWPDPAVLPDWAAHVLDARPEEIGSHPMNLSEYYRENSQGRFTLTGDVHYITTLHDEEYYHTSFGSDDAGMRGALIREALETLTDPKGAHRIDLRRYDLWSCADDFAQTPGADGNIDMIWFMTRTYHDDPGRALTAGKRWQQFNRTAADFNVERAPFIADSVRVNAVMGTVHGLSSGLMIVADNTNKPVYLYDEATTKDGHPTLYGELIHEFSHHLFGAGHFGDGTRWMSNTRFGSYFTGYSANSGNCFGNHLAYEKQRLGWIEEGAGLCIVRAGESDVTVTLDDPAASGDGHVFAVRIEVPGSTQCWYLENRGWKGRFEGRWAPYNGPQAVQAPGLLLSHIITEDPQLFMSKACVVCADGRFRWRVDTLDPGYWPSHCRDAIAKDSADPYGGYDEREHIYVPGQTRWWYAGYWPNDPGKPAARGPYRDCTNCGDAATAANDNIGDKYDLFTAGDVITPWSNPTFTLWNDKEFVPPTPANLGVHVVSFDEGSGSYTVRIVRGDLSALPPARPTGLRRSTPAEIAAMHGRSAADQAGVALQWSPSREPSMTGSAHGVYRLQRSFDGSTYTQIVELQHPAVRFTDADARAASARDVYYRLVAADPDSRASNPSEPLHIRR